MGIYHTLAGVWLVYYNTGRPHPGYHNMGRRPAEPLMSSVSRAGQVDIEPASHASCRNGFTIRSLPSTSMPSCMSSEWSLSQPFARAAATIMES